MAPVIQDRYVPIPPELTAHCQMPVFQGKTVGDLKAYAFVIWPNALAACNERLDAIGKVQATLK